MQNDDCQKAFEAKLEDASTYDFSRDKDGDYIKPDAWEAYQGWKAARTISAEELESLKCKIGDILITKLGGGYSTERTIDDIAKAALATLGITVRDV